MLQIIETRILSVVAFYHLAFFAISMAMFGMTAGSLFVYFKSRFFPADRLFENLSWIGAAFSIAVVLSSLLMISTVLVSIPRSPVMSALLWLKLIVILLPPYFFAGMAISLALTRSPWPVGLVYGVDMIGAATGCLGVLLLLEWMDGVSALFAVGAIAAAGAACFAAARRAGGDAISSSAIHLPGIARLALLRHPARLAILFAVFAVLNAVIQPYGITLSVVKNHLETDKPAVLRWNSFSRIKAGQDEVGVPAMWGPSSISPAVTVSQRWMNIDGLAGTSMYRFSGDFAELDFLRYDVTNLAYTIRNHGRSAVIGVGGGRDLLSAYMFGIHDVTGVELNPIFIDMLTGPFRHYNGLVGLPGIRLFVDEARSWFARTSERFDLIEMSLIDTWAATGAGAFSLSENGLYTVQGWHHFLDALTPTGVFTVSRWYDPTNLAEIGRLLSLAATALRSRGIEQPDAHIFLAGTPVLATLIVANAPFAADDLARLRAKTEELGFKVLLSPGQPAAAPVLRQVVEANSPDEIADLARTYHLDLTAATDDRPFFFNQLILTDPASLKLAMNAHRGTVQGNLLAIATVVLIVVLSTILVVFTMIVPALPSLRQAPGRLARLGTLYFALIGFGFMFIEIGLIQRLSVFLGHPVYGLAIGLFGIIIATGIGALASEWVKLDTGAKIFAWAGALGAYIAVMTMWFSALVLTFEGSSLLTRIIVSVAAIIPPGVLMGFGFPAGMRMVNVVDSRPTPWFWAVNGAAGVLAASIAIATSIAFSINVSLWVGAGCYFLLGPISLALGRGDAVASELRGARLVR